MMALVFPVVWRCVDIYGVAKVDLTFHDIVHNKVVKVTIIPCSMYYVIVWEPR